MGLPFTYQFFSNGYFPYSAKNIAASNAVRTSQLLFVLFICDEVKSTYDHTYTGSLLKTLVQYTWTCMVGRSTKVHLIVLLVVALTQILRILEFGYNTMTTHNNSRCRYNSIGQYMRRAKQNSLYNDKATNTKSCYGDCQVTGPDAVDLLSLYVYCRCVTGMAWWKCVILTQGDVPGVQMRTAQTGFVNCIAGTMGNPLASLDSWNAVLRNRGE